MRIIKQLLLHTSYLKMCSLHFCSAYFDEPITKFQMLQTRTIELGTLGLSNGDIHLQFATKNVWQ